MFCFRDYVQTKTNMFTIFLLMLEEVPFLAAIYAWVVLALTTLKVGKSALIEPCSLKRKRTFIHIFSSII